MNKICKNCKHYKSSIMPPKGDKCFGDMIDTCPDFNATAEEKLLFINKLIADGFKPDGYTMFETYRHWVYCKKNDHEDMKHFDSVLTYWEEDEAKRIELEKAKSGDTDINAYFKNME